MNKSMLLKLVVALFVLIIALSAFAADGSTMLTVNTPVQLNGKQVAAGQYKLSWAGKDANVQVTLSQGKNQVVTAPAKIVENKMASPYTAIVRESDKVKEIHLDGKKMYLVFNE